jgi:hypothetical protein
MLCLFELGEGGSLVILSLLADEVKEELECVQASTAREILASMRPLLLSVVLELL